ncbi:MAG: hypothetical protein WCD37_12595 [Chloroflexia bacterium]
MSLRLSWGSLSRVQQTLIVLAAYSVLTVAMTWPLALHFANTLPDGSDGWQEMWGLWWVKTALVDLHTNPYYTDYLYHPNGVSLYFHPLQPVNGLIGVPFQVIGFSLPAVYNLLVSLGFVFAGYGMYLLVRHLTGAEIPAFIAGCAYTFCPYHFAHLLGQLNLVSLQWMPFYILALFKAWGNPDLSFRQTQSEQANKPVSARRQIGYALLAGLLMVVNFYTEWLYAVLMSLFTVWFFAWRLLIGRNTRSNPASVAKTWHKGLVLGAAKLAAYVGVCLALLGPVVLPMLRETQEAGYMIPQSYEVEFFSADLTDVIVPNFHLPLWKGLLSPVLTEHYQSRYPAERLVFVGYTVLVLAVLAVWRLWRSRAVLFWALTALWAWMVSLGPLLHVWGGSEVLGTRISLPYVWLDDLPFMSILRVPARISVLIMLALAVLVGYALTSLVNKKPSGEANAGNRQGLIRLKYAAIGLLILVEFTPVPFPLMPRSYDIPLYHSIGQEPGDFAILELPLRPVALYMAYQTIHRRPIIGGYLSRLPPDTYIENSLLLRYLLPSTPADDPIHFDASSTGVAELRRIDVRYVIVHWQWIPEEEIDAMRVKLDLVFGGMVVQAVVEENITFYQIGP